MPIGPTGTAEGVWKIVSFLKRVQELLGQSQMCNLKHTSPPEGNFG